METSLQGTYVSESNAELPNDDSTVHKIDNAKQMDDSLLNQNFLRVPLNPTVNGQQRHRDEIINEKRSVESRARTYRN